LGRKTGKNKISRRRTKDVRKCFLNVAHSHIQTFVAIETMKILIIQKSRMAHAEGDVKGLKVFFTYGHCFEFNF